MSLLMRRLMPKDGGDLFGLAFVAILLVLITCNELNMIYQMYKIESDTFNSIVTLIIGIYILFNVLVNMFYAIYKDSTIYSTELPTILLPGWRYCAACQMNSPPRSFHCFTCGQCVLKRSHHCMFLGKCIGYNNARYYFYFMIYVWIGSIYANVLNVEYIVDLMHGFSPKTLVITFMPLIAWLFGLVDHIQLFSVFVNTACIMISLVLFFYMIVNFRMALHNQTWFENANHIRDYDLDLASNFVDIFGFNWLAAFFWPLAPLKLPGNGTNFKKSAINSETVKNI